MGVVDPLPAVLRVAPFAGSVAAGFDSLAAPVTPTAGDRPSWGNVEPSRQPPVGKTRKIRFAKPFLPTETGTVERDFPDISRQERGKFFPFLPDSVSELDTHNRQ